MDDLPWRAAYLIQAVRNLSRAYAHETKHWQIVFVKTVRLGAEKCLPLTLSQAEKTFT